MQAAVFLAYSRPSMGCRKQWANWVSPAPKGQKPGAGQTRFQLLPALRCTHGAPALGPRHAASHALRAPSPSCSFHDDAGVRVQGVDECGIHLRSGSPPVSTTRRWPAPAGHCAAMVSASAKTQRSRTCRPACRPCPPVGVAELADGLGAVPLSRPVQRLQPAKRQNTAGVPVPDGSPSSLDRSFRCEPIPSI